MTPKNVIIHQNRRDALIRQIATHRQQKTGCARHVAMAFVTAQSDEERVDYYKQMLLERKNWHGWSGGRRRPA